MISEFIEAFKISPFYSELFNRDDVIGIYIIGSYCTGITDARSDFDINVLTVDGTYWEASELKYLLYKGKKVHWNFVPLKTLLSFDYKDLRILFPIQFKNLREEITIYENPNYTNILEKLYNIKDSLSTLGIYYLYEMKKDYIDDILSVGEISEVRYSKYLYHLSLASYYLLGEDLDVEFLKAIKRIRWEYVSEECKLKAVERLRLYKAYLDAYPLDIASELAKLRTQTGL